MNELKQELEQFTGSCEFLKDPFNKCVMTEGFQYFMDKAECHWLFSDYAIEIMMTPKLKEQDFFVLKIVVKDNKGKVTLDDGNGNILHKKEYTYTDFPLEEYEFYIQKNELGSFTFMLKGEY
tara:strand:+ start:343 stop:708 length:366 start_codon:yes stop_codon:yes gene_type:complete